MLRFVVPFLIFFSGCIPVVSVNRTGASGVIVDDTTDIPVAGATVELKAPLFRISDGFRGDGARIIRVVTDQAGRFHISPSKYVWFHPGIIAVDPQGHYGLLSVTHPGYRAQNHVFFQESFEGATVTLRRIEQGE